MRQREGGPNPLSGEGSGIQDHELENPLGYNNKETRIFKAPHEKIEYHDVQGKGPFVVDQEAAPEVMKQLQELLGQFRTRMQQGKNEQHFKDHDYNEAVVGEALTSHLLTDGFLTSEVIARYREYGEDFDRPWEMIGNALKTRKADGSGLEKETPNQEI